MNKFYALAKTNKEPNLLYVDRDKFNEKITFVATDYVIVRLDYDVDTKGINHPSIHTSDRWLEKYFFDKKYLFDSEEYLEISLTNNEYKKLIKPNKTDEDKDIVNIRFAKYVYNQENTYGIPEKIYTRYFNRNYLRAIVNFYFNMTDNITLRIIENDSDNIVNNNLIAIVKDKEIVAFLAGCTPTTNKK